MILIFSRFYPQIDLRWKEVGLSFQVQFERLDFVEGQELGQELGQFVVCAK